MKGDEKFCMKIDIYDCDKYEQYTELWQEYLKNKEKLYKKNGREPILPTGGDIKDEELIEIPEREDVEEELKKYGKYFELKTEINNETRCYILKLLGDWREIIPLIYFLNYKRVNTINYFLNGKSENLQEIKQRFEKENNYEIEFEFEGIRWKNDELSFAFVDAIEYVIKEWEIIAKGDPENTEWEDRLKVYFPTDKMKKQYYTKGVELIENEYELKIENYYDKDKFINGIRQLISYYVKTKKLGILTQVYHTMKGQGDIFFLIDFDMRRNLFLLSMNTDFKYIFRPREITDLIKSNIEKLISFKKFISGDKRTSLLQFEKVRGYIFNNFKYDHRGRYIDVGISSIPDFISYYYKRYRYLYKSLDESVKDVIKFKVSTTILEFSVIEEIIEELEKQSKEKGIYITTVNEHMITYEIHKKFEELIEYELGKSASGGIRQGGGDRGEAVKTNPQKEKMLKNYLKIVKDSDIKDAYKRYLRTLYFVCIDNINNNATKKLDYAFTNHEADIVMREVDGGNHDYKTNSGEAYNVFGTWHARLEDVTTELLPQNLRGLTPAKIIKRITEDDLIEICNNLKGRNLSKNSTN